MKKLIILLGFILISYSGRTQTAAYYCSQTGAIGYCYGTSDVLSCAYQNSLYYGAIAPTLVINTSQSGYGALAVGTNTYGIPVVGIVAGYSDAIQARRAAINKCSSVGGTNIYIKDSWLDY